MWGGGGRGGGSNVLTDYVRAGGAAEGTNLGVSDSQDGKLERLKNGYVHENIPVLLQVLRL